jgi:hypothetical protein
MMEEHMEWQMVGRLGVIAFLFLIVMTLLLRFRRRPSDAGGKLSFADVFLQAMGRAWPPDGRQ